MWLPLECPALGNLECNPGVCPHWELNQRPFGSQASAQSIEPHQPGLTFVLKDLNGFGIFSEQPGSVSGFSDHFKPMDKSQRQLAQTLLLQDEPG